MKPRLPKAFAIATVVAFVLLGLPAVLPAIAQETPAAPMDRADVPAPLKPWPQPQLRPRRDPCA